VRKGATFRDVEVGRRLRALRLQRGLTQEDMAGRLGLTFQQVQKYEKGSNRIGAGRLGQMAEILEVSISIFYETNIKEATRPLLELADTAGALRLFQAYDRIVDPEIRKGLVSLAERIADSRRELANVGSDHETERLQRGR
jgi:transcriptional regulator with XRE-family HTH domain